MLIINNDRYYSINEYYNFLTQEGKELLFKLRDNDNDIEEYLKGLYFADKNKFMAICNDLDCMKKKWGMISFEATDPDKSLLNQSTNHKIELDFNTLTLTDHMRQILSAQ